MEACSNWLCQFCGYVGLEDGSDGFFYCLRCLARAEDIIDTSTPDEDIVSGGIYLRRHRRARAHVMEITPIRQQNPLYGSQPELLKALGLEDLIPQILDDDKGLSMAGSLAYEDYFNAVRMRYVMGLQVLLQLQCKKLVEEFKVTPLICDLAEKIWLAYVMQTNVLGHNWADKVILESEEQSLAEPSEENSRKMYGKHKGEYQNYFGKRAVIIWYKSLRKTIPLDCTLAISFLACHLAREAVLPLDITKWAIERKLPYLAAFVDIEKLMGPPVKACPIPSNRMFDSSRHVLPRGIESLASTIADSIGLELPPVNFFEITSRYLRQLQLPLDKILPKAMLIYDWSMPPDLWLSTNESRSPTHLCVLSIIIVAIRMLYNINGLGFWEKSLSNNAVTSHKSKRKAASDSMSNEEDAAKLLHQLHSLYARLPQNYEHTKDLQTYLKYCDDFVFVGLEPSSEYYFEKIMIETLWNYYQNFSQDEEDPSEPEVLSNSCLKQKKSRDKTCSSSKVLKRTTKKAQKCLNKHQSSDDDDACIQRMSLDDFHVDSLDLEKESKIEGSQGNEEAIKILLLDMKENEFHYIPPRKNPKKFGYIHYGRKKDNGVFTYVAHADYYILLRAFAQAAEVNVRVMHVAILNFEKRLSWIEDKIENTLCFMPEKIRCEHCEHCESKTRRMDDKSKARRKNGKSKTKRND